MLASQFNSFGFDINGSFDFQVRTSNQTTLLIFLATYDEMKQRVIKNMAYSDICTNSSLHVSNLNSSFSYNSTRISWNGTINAKNIYYPYVLNCNSNKSLNSVITNFQNPMSHLDFRDEHYAEFSTILAMVYLLLSIIWLINILSNPKFGIVVPPLFSLICVIKTLISIEQVRIWLDRKQGIVGYDYHGSVVYNLMLISYYTLFLSLPTFLISGFSVFRDKIAVSETCFTISSSLILVIGLWSLNFVSNFQIALFSMCLISVGFLCIVRNNVDYLIMLGKLDESIPETMYQLRSKISMLSQFSMIAGSIFAALIILYSIAASFGFWKIVSDLLVEFCIFLIQIAEMHFFMFRKSYQGEINENADDLESEILIQPLEDGESKHFSIYMFHQPKFKDFAIINATNP